MPYLDGIRSVGDVLDVIRTIGRGDCEVRRGQRGHEAVHLRMDLAQQRRETFLLEREALHLALGPGSEIETIGTRLRRKDVMQQGVGVEEVDGRSFYHRQDV